MSKSLVDQFLEGFGNAVRDVREKVVEEGWFGRAVTDNIPSEPQMDAHESAGKAFGSHTHSKEAGHGPTRDEQSPTEPGFDR